MTTVISLTERLQTLTDRYNEAINNLRNYIVENNKSNIQLFDINTLSNKDEIKKIYDEFVASNAHVTATIDSIINLKSTINYLIEIIKDNENNNGALVMKKFKKRFEYEGTYVDFEVLIEDNDFGSFTILTPTFKYDMCDVRMCDVRMCDTLGKFLYGYYAGSNSSSYYNPAGDRFKFGCEVHGSGGDIFFDFSVPMEVAIGMNEVIKEAGKYCMELNGSKTLAN
jgi:hypothetical protein